MNASSGKLRLGPLPKTESVRLTIALPSTLMADIERYAVLHARIYGEPVSAAALIPHILQAFIARDRDFKKAGSTKLSSSQ